MSRDRFLDHGSKKDQVVRRKEPIKIREDRLRETAALSGMRSTLKRRFVPASR